MRPNMGTSVSIWLLWFYRTSKHKSFWSKRHREGKLTAFFRNTQTLKLKSSLWASSPGCSGSGERKERRPCNLGLDTNTTKNRLNMFPEIPDFFLNISKSSQYLKKIFGYLYLGYCNYVCAIRIPLPISLWLSVDWAVRFPQISVKGKRVRT